jgi:hypothetical protein
MFNALKYIKSLEAVGFRREQAEAQIQLVFDAIEEDVATKADITEVRSDFAKLRGEFGELKADFGELRGEFGELRGEFGELKGFVTTEFANVRSEFNAGFAQIRQEMAALRSDLIFKLGSLIVVCWTLSTAVLGLLIKM